MWSYSQSRGMLKHDGAFEGSGYSGHGAGLNAPDMEAIHGQGPIPRGHWKITEWDAQHGALGPIVGILEPVGHNAHGRTLFRIHGDNAEHDHTASDGCIILSRVLREKMRDSGDTDLEVTS